MRTESHQKVKIKRILLYYTELDRLKVNHEASMELMSYVFSVSEIWLMRVIRENQVDELKNIKLKHWDLDLKVIDDYARKIQRQAKKERKQMQLNMF